ncbi:AtpZ/AtpI family protein [Vulgatibacter sp.]|uniref:AtpZ/AtpI family protein n=1 Tax=Vulgatibacter sp. TaxID=1971226 RepID=UPI003566E7C5
MADHDDRDPDRRLAGLSGFARAMRAAEPYLQASWSLAGGVALGVIAGYFADKKLGTTPWLLVAGACLGMALGIYAFIKAILEAEKRQKPRR